MRASFIYLYKLIHIFLMMNCSGYFFCLQISITHNRNSIVIFQSIRPTRQRLLGQLLNQKHHPVRNSAKVISWTKRRPTVHWWIIKSYHLIAMMVKGVFVSKSHGWQIVLERCTNAVLNKKNYFIGVKLSIPYFKYT